MVDLSPFLAASISVAGVILPTVTVILVNKGIGVFQAHTHIQLTGQQVDKIQIAAQTGAGLIQAALAKGTMQLHDVSVSSPKVQQITADAMAPPVLQAATAQGVTLEHMASIIVGRVGAALAADPTVPTIAGVGSPPLTVVKVSP